jgi:hypothetical protein
MIKYQIGGEVPQELPVALSLEPDSDGHVGLYASQGDTRVVLVWLMEDGSGILPCMETPDLEAAHRLGFKTNRAREWMVS